MKSAAPSVFKRMETLRTNIKTHLRFMSKGEFQEPSGVSKPEGSLGMTFPE